MFKSFFLAGFECTAGFNSSTQWIDQLAATDHDEQVWSDYALLDGIGIRVVREGIRWPLVDRSPRYDFSSVTRTLQAVNDLGTQVIWDLFHYGYPKELDPFSQEFVERFQRYCYAVGLKIREETDGPYYFTPVNEPSYLAYAAGEKAMFPPYLTGKGWELKVGLVRAALRGIEALREACPGCRIVNVDPICHVVADPGAEEADRLFAEDFNERLVYQAFDILAGTLLPELGGSPDHLDIVGINYYRANQWVLGQESMPLALGDLRRVSLADLLLLVQHRYQRDIVITETADRDDLRVEWLRYVIDESALAIDRGIPLRGVCIYPVLGMPEWHMPHEWAQMGLWEIDPITKRRVPVSECIELLTSAQDQFEGVSETDPRLATLLGADAVTHDRAHDTAAAAVVPRAPVH